MLKLNKKTEYALIALRYVGQKPPGEWASVHEVSARFQIPLDMLAKIMQTLKRAGIVESVQGFGGGYALARDPYELSLSGFFDLFAERTALTDCCETHDETCERHGRCEIRGMMSALNERITRALCGLTLGDILNLDGRTALLPKDSHSDPAQALG
jgi:Rrf2 family protein